MRHEVFVTGGSGYLGAALIRALVERGHKVHALVRAGSGSSLPAGCAIVLGDALDAASYADRVAPSDTFVQLVGVSKPAPWKARQFRAVDLRSAFAAVEAARRGGVRHFVYVSVAQPAPTMRAYVEVRAECEQRIRESGLDATILRPWYVIGPKHHWPLVLVPAYAVLERIPRTREAAIRLGLVRRPQMVGALVRSIETPPRGIRILDTRAIRSGSFA